MPALAASALSLGLATLGETGPRASLLGRVALGIGLAGMLLAFAFEPAPGAPRAPAGTDRSHPYDLDPR